MELGKAADALGAIRRQAEADLAAVTFRPNPFQKSALLQPVGKANRAVMAQNEVLGELADRRAVRFAKAPNREEHLVLLRLQAGATRGFLAEMEESADLVTEIAEGAVLPIGHSVYIVSRYY